jgi:hypothetical protein
MLSVRLTSCATCTNVPALLSNINCKLHSLSKDLYGNTVLALNKPINKCDIIKLLHYKRILTYRLCNEMYANDFSLEKISSKIKILTNE